MFIRNVKRKYIIEDEVLRYVLYYGGLTLSEELRVELLEHRGKIELIQKEITTLDNEEFSSLSRKQREFAITLYKQIKKI